MIELLKYESKFKEDWDDVVSKSRIDSFLFKRNFMDYHNDRFEDNSYLIFKNGKLEGLLPGNISNKIWYSHQGLTYGGLVSTIKLTTVDVLIIFELLNKQLKNIGITDVIIKPTPYIYHKYPSQEELYALYRNEAIRISCNLSSTIFKPYNLTFTELRQRGIKKANKNNIVIRESSDLLDFWNILEFNLEKTYGKKPVHSFTEIKYLKNLFPENIKLFCSYFKEQIVAGVVVFIMENIIHVQYISASHFGKKNGALDLLFHNLINERFTNYLIFDFGQSTEDYGRYLNEGLIFQKEGFGGRGIVYETFNYKLK